MDMKKILQALDGASTKPVEGSNDMKQYLRLVKEADLNQPSPQEDTAPPIDSKENFLAHMKKETGQQDLSAIENVIATDPDGTIDIEETFLLMFQQFIDMIPELYTVFNDLVKEIEKAKANPAEWAKFSPEDQQGMEAALADFQKTAPKMQAEIAKMKQDFEKELPAMQQKVAQNQNTRFKQKTGLDMVRTGTGAKTNIGTQDYSNPTAQSPVYETLRLQHLAGVLTEGKGPLNRLTQAESIAMQSAAKKKTITSPVLNVAEDAKPSMIGKYFKEVETELLEANERSKTRARKLAERVIERVTPNADGSLPDPSINRLTGKPNPPAAEPASGPSNLKPTGSTVEYGGATYNVSVFGDGIRPRIGRSDKVITAKAYVVGDRMYVLLDPTTQEDIEEGLRDPKDNPCWKGYKPVGTKKKGGKTVPNCVPKESVQKKGPAGQLKGKDKVDVKGTVLGSKEKSQKGLRGKLVGGAS